MSALPRTITPRTIPKAYYERRLTVDDVMSSRMIKPLHVLDRCVETDNANAILVTTAEWAKT